MAYYPRAAVVLTVLLEDWADGSGNDTLTVEVVPRTLEWVRNHAREADTFRVSVDWRDLPIDPRAARSILVTAAVADAGTAGGTLRYDRSNAVVMGYADEPRIVCTPHIGAATQEAQPRIARPRPPSRVARRGWRGGAGPRRSPGWTA